jgi:Restriction endonuclease
MKTPVCRVPISALPLGIGENRPMSEPKLVVPSEIPWEQLKGEALEELVYWICDAIGAVDVVWRAGSATGTSRDRGRDVEATFHHEEPDGDFRAQRWWLQAKGRSKTLEPAAVKEAANDAQGARDLDVLVLATNSRFSNDTRDWVEEFQEIHPRPVIKLWDRTQLEQMASAHPAVVARIAPQALSPQGRLEAATSAFFNRGEWPQAGDLDLFWEMRTELEFGSDGLLTCVVGEAARGGLVTRPWAGELDAETLAGVLITGLANSGALLVRTQGIGRDTDGLADGLTHLIAATLIRFNEETALGFIEDPWSYTEGPQEERERLRDLLIEPIMNRLLIYFGAACEADCLRVSADFEIEREGDVRDRWLSVVPSRYGPPPPEEERQFIVIESAEEPCAVGLELSDERQCPFVTGTERPWKDIVSDLRAVMAYRIGERVKEVGSADTPESNEASSVETDGSS